MNKVPPLIGTVSFPGDKSLSHRSAMFSAIAQGRSSFSNVSDGGDVTSTLSVLGQLGAEYERLGDQLVVEGKGLRSLHGENLELDCGNSGTSLRLFTGLLCGQNVKNVSLVGDKSLSKRPHDRVIVPLQKIGVDITGRDSKYTPVVINSSQVQSAEIEMELASAQVKSAMLLAGLYADGPLSVIEYHRTRDHTENMLSAMGVDINVQENVDSSSRTITIIPPSQPLQPLDAIIPGDPSSAAFFGIAAAIIPESDVTLKSVLLNPTRSAWIDVLVSMGADITITPLGMQCGEAVGDINVKYSQLSGITIDGDVIASLIDELPVLSLAMSKAQGISQVRDANELRVKESDRISVVVDHLSRAGISILEQEDGYDIEGGHISEVDVFADGDHRIAMTFAILNYCVTGTLKNDDIEVISTSFPRFFELFESLIAA